MGKLDANRNGIPDFAEGMFGSPNQNVMSASRVPAQTEAPRRSAPLPASLAPDTSNGLMLALAGLSLIALCAGGAGAIWYFFLR